MAGGVTDALTSAIRRSRRELYRRPELARALDPAINLEDRPLSDTGELFIQLLILHLGSTYQAMKDGVFLQAEGVQKDIARFFSLPIPRVVWNRWKEFQEEDFVRFVEDALAPEGHDRSR
jgi:hypothetical protein